MEALKDRRPWSPPVARFRRRSHCVARFDNHEFKVAAVRQISVSGTVSQINSVAGALVGLYVIGASMRSNVSQVHLVDEILVIRVELKWFSPKILHFLIAMRADILEPLKVLNKVPDVAHEAVF